MLRSTFLNELLASSISTRFIKVRTAPASQHVVPFFPFAIRTTGSRLARHHRTGSTKRQGVGALLLPVGVLPWDQQVLSSWTAEETNTCAHRCLRTLFPTGPDRSPLKLKDVQQNDLAISGQKTVPMLVGPKGGKHAIEATATFRVAEVRDNTLSLGKLVRKGFSFTLGRRGCSMQKDGRSVPLYLERNSLRVEAHVLERASRPGNVAAGTAVADELMDDVDVKESHASSSADPAVEPAAEVATTPAPVLNTWSSNKELHSRLRELGAPIYGTKVCSFDGCANTNRSQPRRRRRRSIWKPAGRSYRTDDTKDPPWSSPAL